MIDKQKLLELRLNPDQAIGFIMACVLFGDAGDQKERSISAELTGAGLLEEMDDGLHKEFITLLPQLEAKYTKE